MYLLTQLCVYLICTSAGTLLLFELNNLYVNNSTLMIMIIMIYHILFSIPVKQNSGDYHLSLLGKWFVSINIPVRGEHFAYVTHTRELQRAKRPPIKHIWTHATPYERLEEEQKKWLWRPSLQFLLILVWWCSMRSAFQKLSLEQNKKTLKLFKNSLQNFI